MYDCLGIKVFPWKLCQSKNGVCDESPPKRWTVAETFAWRLNGSVWLELAESAVERVVLLQLLSIHDGAVGVTNLGAMLLWSWSIIPPPPPKKKKKKKKHNYEDLKVFCTSGLKLVILAWMADELWCGQTQNEVNLDLDLKFDL